jgi:hypothetical protein
VGDSKLMVSWAESPERLADAMSGRAPAIYPRDGAPPGKQVPGCIWPHIRGWDDNSGFSAGPTGEPWIDANGWRIRVARATAGEPLWLGYKFPAGLAIQPERYQLGIAEAAVYGASWLITPDDKLRESTLKGDDAAKATWSKAAAAVDFFAAHSAWRDYAPMAQLVAVSDFTVPERILAMETINMAARRQMTCRVLRPAAVSAASLGQAAAVLWIDRKPVPEPVVDLVKSGALLVMSGGAPPVSGLGPVADDSHPRFQIRSLGKGRVAVSRKPWTDPFLIAADTQVLVSKRNEILKLWNNGAMMATYSVPRDGSGGGLVQILNYTCHTAAHPVSVRVEQPFRAARLHTLGSPAPVELAVAKSGRGVEVGLPLFPVFTAVEFLA